MSTSDGPRRLTADAARWLRAKASDLIRSSLDRVESTPIVERSISAALRQRARRAGADDALLALAASDELTQLRSRLAVYRLLSMIGEGDLSRLPYLFDKVGNTIPDAERWSIYRLAGFPVDRVADTSDSRTLTTELGPSIAAEFDAAGQSALFEWLVGQQRFDLDDPGFRQLITHRCDRALQQRLEAETRLDAPQPDLCRSALAALASIDTSDIDVFPSGSTLLTLRQHGSGFRERVLELGTMTDLRLVESQLSARDAVTLHRSADWLRVVHLPTRVVANVFRYRMRDGRFAQSTPHYTRWHEPFGLTTLTAETHRYLVPDDVDRYLDERFGNWRTPTLFFDRVFDSPNTTPNESLESLLYLYRRSKHAFATGTRFFADAAAERMRDTFGIDYTMHVPQPVHPKVLSTPFSPIDAAGRDVVVIAAGFHHVTAVEIGQITAAATNDRYVVAAVHDDGAADVNDRLARVKSVRVIDHVAVFDSVAELAAVCADVGAVSVHADPDLDMGLTSGLDLDVIVLGPPTEAVRP